MTNQINDKINFSKHLSFEDYKILWDHDHSRPEGDDISIDPSSEYKVWLEKDREIFQTIVSKAMISFLAELKNNGYLKPVLNSENISTQFIDSWNAVANTDNLVNVTSAMVDIAGRFESTMMLRICLSHMNLEDGYKNYCETMTQGDISCLKTNINETCSITGQRAIIQFNQWECTFGSFKNGKFSLAEPTAKRSSVYHQSIEFKTGNLMIADWFRIDEFTSAVTEDNNISLESEYGREIQTKHYAEKFGFISVCIGNTCPNILENNGKIIVGTIENLANDFKNHGYVCTDLWAATIIEEETLIEIVAGQVGLEKARSIVAEYSSENDVTKVKVNPGQYHLYFHGDYHGFHKSFATDALQLASACKPLFVLSNEILELKATNLVNENSIQKPMRTKFAR